MFGNSITGQERPNTFLVAWLSEKTSCAKKSLMNSKEIEQKVSRIFDTFSKDEFIYDLFISRGS
jgi:hypothetical protein